MDYKEITELEWAIKCPLLKEWQEASKERDRLYEENGCDSNDYQLAVGFCQAYANAMNYIDKAIEKYKEQCIDGNDN